MLLYHTSITNRRYHKNQIGGIKKTITMRNKIGAMLQGMAVSFS